MSQLAVEEIFFKKYLTEHFKLYNSKLKTQTAANYIVLTKPVTIDGPEFDTSVTVTNLINSPFYVDNVLVSYNRFRISDYKEKKEDEFLLVPAKEVTNKIKLINYMNDLYLHSVNIRKIFETNSLYNNKLVDTVYGEQIKLRVENLKSFDLNFPAPGNVLFIAAKEDSYLFKGSLRIKFV